MLRDLFADPRLSVVHSSWWPVVRRLGWVAARFGIPLQVAQALARPAAARRRLDRLGRRLRQPPMPPTSTTAQERLDLVVRLLGDAVVRIVPRVMPPAAAGFAMLGLAGRLLGADARPGDLETVLRGLPHNVTTEMDLELWIWPPRSWPTTTLPRWSGSSRRPSSQSDTGPNVATGSAGPTAGVPRPVRPPRRRGDRRRCAPLGRGSDPCPRRTGGLPASRRPRPGSRCGVRSWRR